MAQRWRPCRWAARWPGALLKEGAGRLAEEIVSFRTLALGAADSRPMEAARGLDPLDRAGARQAGSVMTGSPLGFALCESGPRGLADGVGVVQSRRQVSKAQPTGGPPAPYQQFAVQGRADSMMVAESFTIEP